MNTNERKQARRKQELRRAQQRHREKKRRESSRKTERERRKKSVEREKRAKHTKPTKVQYTTPSIFQRAWQRIWRRLRILFGPTKPPAATRLKPYMEKYHNIGMLPHIDWKHESNNRYVGCDAKGYHYKAWPSRRGIGYCVVRTLVTGSQFYLGKYYELEGIEEEDPSNDEDTDDDRDKGQSVHSIGF